MICFNILISFASLDTDLLLDLGDKFILVIGLIGFFIIIFTEIMLFQQEFIIT